MNELKRGSASRTCDPQSSYGRFREPEPPSARGKAQSMKRVIVAASILAAGAMLAVTVVAAPPQGKGGKSASDAPVVPNLGGLEKNMRDLHWGMTHDEVTEAFNKPGGLFDQEYAKQLSKVQPGV